MPRILFVALCLCLSWLHSCALETITTSEQVAAVERSARVHTLLVLASEDKKEDEEDKSIEELATIAYPGLLELEKELDGLVTFSVVDVAPRHKNSLVKKWQLQNAPALIIYKDPPKENPYTGKLYRDAKVTGVDILLHPKKLKKMLKSAIPEDFVDEIDTLQTFEELVDKKTPEESVVVLISKQKHPTPMYRALAAEFYQNGLKFVFLNKKKEGAEEVMQKLKVEDVPAMVVVRSMTEHIVLASEHMKTYKELKGFVQPFATAEEIKGSSEKNDKQKSASSIKFFTSSDFDDLVLKSDLIWVVEFMDSEREQAVTEDEWKKTFTDVHRKAGMVALGAVSCMKEAELCGRFGGPGARVFPLTLTEEKKLKRGETLAQTFKTTDEAKEVAIETIPDLTVTVESAADLNAFIARARGNQALPILFFTSKKTTPPMMKALVLSIPSQKVMLAVIPDADPDVKQQFLVKSSASTSMVCLVPTAPDPANPTAAPFGIVAYQKKMMGPFTYPNIMQFVLQVLAQYPHPQDVTPESENVDFSSMDEASAKSLVPYLTKENIDTLCGGNKICAIGFFEDHQDTLSDPESRLSKLWTTFARVAAQSKQNREPFFFMWVNGKCQKEFAEAFEVGLFQMPTVAVYSPSKQRYATNVGLFDEENVAAFLKSVLSGSIGTAPIGNVPQLGQECSFDDIQEIAVGADGVTAEDDEDLDDMLSEIISDEKHQRDELEKELASERKAKKSKKGKKSKKSKKKSKKKKGARDEL
ncbi:hypothetical protein PHYBOEH_005067 [Phytophthora boehmeriae]|uniref:Thioredoxin domain-containing protein n=1 Tax=Phytophthora boehmeriae TaxID=109152 RepID=A0A8T1WPR5_9STRA|nr:hypothetical protein PHYBOEH_005067 [Phytophthora boehmeriae]